MDRGVFGQEDSLIFLQGQSEFAAFDPGLAASRRRIVRRPLGSGYQAQTIVFSERDRDASPSLTGSEPLSELLQQLAASRKSMMEGGPPSRPAGGAGNASASVLSSLGLVGADGAERPKRVGGEANRIIGGHCLGQTTRNIPVGA